MFSLLDKFASVSRVYCQQVYLDKFPFTSLPCGVYSQQFSLFAKTVEVFLVQLPSFPWA